MNILGYEYCKNTTLVTRQKLGYEKSLLKKWANLPRSPYDGRLTYLA